MSLNQLFGKLDLMTKEWTEGVLGDIYRKCANSQNIDRQLMVLDGPVDAEWIENLNTVLDDNKKLCLLNGDVIHMSQYTTMLFEVSDLKSASPATISRCGMVYFQQETITVDNMIDSFLQSIVPRVEEWVNERLELLFDGLMADTLQFIDSKCESYQAIHQLALCQQVMRILKQNLIDANVIQYNIDEIKTKETPPPPEEDPLQQSQVVEEQMIKLDSLFMWSFVTGLTGCLMPTGQKAFEQFIRRKLKEQLRLTRQKGQSFRIDKNSLPNESLMMQDFFYEYKEGIWKQWREQVELVGGAQQQEDDDRMGGGGGGGPTHSGFHKIFVETSESMRIQAQLEQCIGMMTPVLIIGQTGTGKSFITNRFFSRLPPDKQLVIRINFSYQTQPFKVQEVVESMIERKRKGVHGPPKIGQKAQIFIDDLNVPTRDKYGVQTPIELLKLFCDYSGWYGKDRRFLQVIDSNIVSSMCPQGGTATQISSRLIRHFIIIGCQQQDAKNLFRICQTINKKYYNCQSQPPNAHIYIETLRKI